MAKRVSHGRIPLHTLLRRPCRCIARVCFQQFIEHQSQVEDARTEFGSLPREKKDAGEDIRHYFVFEGLRK